MCIEDVRLGRAVAVSELHPRVGATSSLIVQSAPNRVVLIFYPPVSGTVTYSLLPGVTAGRGLLLTTTSAPMVFDIKKHGNLTTQAWYAIHSVGGVVCPIQEGLLEQQ